MKKVCVMGLGYVGLPTSAILANHGVRVVGVDINPNIINSVNLGLSHITENGLEQLVHHAVTAGFLSASITCEPAETFIIAVPTPFKKAYQPDLACVESAVRMIAPCLKKGDLIILESTSPVGTTENIACWLSKLRPDLTFPVHQDVISDVAICYCPERVLPGNALEEIIHNDRIIGGITSRCAQKALELYETFIKGRCLLTDAKTAELTKLAENAFRDVNIAYANELSMLCDTLNIDVWRLIELANHHPRVNILQPGPGVGGHCIAVDPWFIVQAAPALTPLIQTARAVNLRKTQYVIEQVAHTIGAVNHPVVAYLGLSFKANIDDLRESPAVEIVSALTAIKNCTHYIVEPHITILPDQLKHLTCLSLEEALQKANIIVLLVDHLEFKKLTPQHLVNKVFIDTRGHRDAIATLATSQKHLTMTTI